MLVNFRVQNFLSFQEEVEFTTLATHERQHRDRIFLGKKRLGRKGLNLLPIAAFYGGNGAGKSNLYQALKFARDLVVKSSGNPEDLIPREPFRLHPACLKDPSIFGLDLLIKDQLLRYQFAITEEAVVEEKLEVLSSVNAAVISRIFHRYRQGEQDVWTEDSFHALELSKDDKEFLKFKTRDTLPNHLFLAAIRGRKMGVLEDVGKWFRSSLAFLDPRGPEVLREVFLNNQGFQNYCLQILQRAGTGIEAIENEEIPLDSALIPTKVREDWMKDPNNIWMKVIRLPNRTQLLSCRNNEQIKVFQVATYHRDQEGTLQRFEMANESDGTERLIDLLPAFFQMTLESTEKVFFIDELDRSLHSQLTRGLIESFLDTRTSDSRTQLFFTTHDASLIDQDLFRRDEIWLLDKLEGGQSKLTALSDFKGVRHDKDIRQQYLLGRYNGVPGIEYFPRAMEE